MKKLVLTTCLVDIFGTILYEKKPIDYLALSDYLIKNGYKVFPRQIEAALNFVTFLDYPKLCINNWASFLRKVLWRLELIVDDETLSGLVNIVEREFRLDDYAEEFLARIREKEFKIVLITNLPEFQFMSAIGNVKELVDSIFTSCSCNCESSNPKMFQVVLKNLKEKPEQAIVIGNDIITDVIIPHRLSIKSVLFQKDLTNLQIREAEAVVHSLKEAADLIIKIK